MAALWRQCETRYQREWHVLKGAETVVLGLKIPVSAVRFCSSALLLTSSEAVEGTKGPETSLPCVLEPFIAFATPASDNCGRLGCGPNSAACSEAGERATCLVIAVITFDADGTLCDFRRVMHAALATALTELQRLVPGDRAGALTVEDLRALRDHVADELHGQSVTLEQVRLAAFARTLKQIGHPDPALAAHLLTVYLERRFGEIALYPDVLPTLGALGDRYRLGLASNGNSYPERSGLGGYFAFVVFAHDHGVQKPDRRFYEIVLEAAGVRVTEVVHVGDSLVNDVGGAQAAGIRAVWLNRHRLPLEAGFRPDAVINSLSELPGILGSLDR